MIRKRMFSFSSSFECVYDPNDLPPRLLILSASLFWILLSCECIKMILFIEDLNAFIDHLKNFKWNIFSFK